MSDIHTVIEKLKVLEAKVMPEVWKSADEIIYTDGTHTVMRYKNGDRVYGRLVGEINGYDTHTRDCEVAELIVVSHNALPKLLAYIEELEEKLREAEFALLDVMERDE